MVSASAATSSSCSGVKNCAVWRLGKAAGGDAVEQTAIEPGRGLPQAGRPAAALADPTMILSALRRDNESADRSAGIFTSIRSTSAPSRPCETKLPELREHLRAMLGDADHGLQPDTPTVLEINRRLEGDDHIRP